MDIGFQLSVKAVFAAFLACVPTARAEPPTRVSWSASIVRSRSPLNQELKIVGNIDQGWHVYAMQQLPGGPTPLRVSLPLEQTVTIAGSPTGTSPQRRHDPGFDLDTDFYSETFALNLPLRGDIAGPVTVSIRFQACSERECLPPKTVDVQAAVSSSEGD
jgi:Disulphide bond corrector protein DsbC